MKLYWPIDRLIDSYIDWSLTEPSWDGRGLMSGLNQYDPLQYSLCFVFFSCANLCGTERTKTNRNTHESIIAVIQWLSMNSKYVCHSSGELGWRGLKWGFEVQHCHLWTGLDATGSQRITSSYWRHWCVFLRCCGSDKEKQRDSWTLHTKDIGVVKSFKVYVDAFRKRQVRSFEGFFSWRIFHICMTLKKSDLINPRLTIMAIWANDYIPKNSFLLKNYRYSLSSV